MNKAMPALASLMILAVLASAPAAAATTFSLGIKAGVSSANNLLNSDNGSEKSLVRPTFGIFGIISLGAHLAIQPEVNYLTTGQRTVVPIILPPTILEFVDTFGYLHIPVLIKYRLVRTGKAIPSAFAGPALGILLSARQRVYTGGSLTDDFNVKNHFRSMDFGADLGAGVEMTLGGMKALIDARYYLGLTDVALDPSGPIFLDSSLLDPDLKNRGLSITVGLIF
jgi:hypothetical protein